MSALNISDNKIRKTIKKINDHAKLFLDQISSTIDHKNLLVYEGIMEDICLIVGIDIIRNKQYLQDILYLDMLVLAPIIFEKDIKTTNSTFKTWFQKAQLKYSKYKEINKLQTTQYSSLQKYLTLLPLQKSNALYYVLLENVSNYQSVCDSLDMTPLGIFAFENNISLHNLQSFILKAIQDKNRPALLDENKTNVPIQNIDFNLAKQWILNAYKELSEEAYILLKNYFNSDKIILSNIPSNQAYTHPINRFYGPIVHIYYDGSLHAVFNLAHEIGHVLQQTLCYDNGVLQMTAPPVLSEIASITSERILANWLTQEIGLSADYIEYRHLHMLQYSTNLLSFTLDVYSACLTQKEIECLFVRYFPHSPPNEWIHLEELFRQPFYASSYIVGYYQAQQWIGRLTENPAEQWQKYAKFLKDSAMFSFEEII
jgi:hypothetical protein